MNNSEKAKLNIEEKTSIIIITVIFGKIFLRTVLLMTYGSIPIIATTNGAVSTSILTEDFN